MRSFRKVAGLALIPAFFWLLMQVLMLASLTQSAVAGLVAALGDADHSITEIVICTPSGFKTIIIGPDGEIPDEAHTAPECRWCQTWAADEEISLSDGHYICANLQDSETLKIVKNSCLSGIASKDNLKIRAPPAA